jgi:hypothetical protein
VALRLTVTETLRGHKVIAVGARAGGHLKHKVIVIGTATVTLAAGRAQVVKIALNRTGKRLLAGHRRLKATLRATQTIGARTIALPSQVVTLKQARRTHRH